jgi:hypothetical protein
MDRSVWYWPASTLAALGLLMLPGCEGGGDTEVEEQALVDTDGDALYDSFEDEIGTDPALEDSDEDGFLDGDEWSAFTNPVDALDYEYLDGDGQIIWSHQAYPADLEGTGYAIGDTLANWAAPDYWIQDVNLYSFYGNVIHIISTADS